MYDNNYLMHYGVLGQKWGVRRYQNYDGSLKVAGKLKRSKNLKDRVKVINASVKALNPETDAKKIAKLENKAERLTERSKRLESDYKKAYAEAYAKDLTEAKKMYDKAFSDASDTLVSSIGQGTSWKSLLSAGNITAAMNATAARINYDRVRSKALTDIPKYTDYNLKLTSKGYKIRNKGEAASIDPKGLIKSAVRNEYDFQTNKGRASVGSIALKSGLDVLDMARTNRNYQKPTKGQSQTVLTSIKDKISPETAEKLKKVESVAKKAAVLTLGASSVYNKVQAIRSVNKKGDDKKNTNNNSKKGLDENYSKTVFESVNNSKTTKSTKSSKESSLKYRDFNEFSDAMRSREKFSLGFDNTSSQTINKSKDIKVSSITNESTKKGKETFNNVMKTTGKMLAVAVPIANIVTTVIDTKNKLK